MTLHAPIERPGPARSNPQTVEYNVHCEIKRKGWPEGQTKSEWITIWAGEDEAEAARIGALCIGRWRETASVVSARPERTGRTQKPPRR